MRSGTTLAAWLGNRQRRDRLPDVAIGATGQEDNRPRAASAPPHVTGWTLCPTTSACSSWIPPRSTRFFRHPHQRHQLLPHPESYEALKDKVFPELAGDRSRHEPVRVWALGCSTGEEAYSLAMVYSEYVEATGKRVPMQIFATDLNGAGIDKARAGLYSKGMAQDVSPERLRRFFVEIDGSYRISKPIRDMCTFGENVLSDPPFSRIDLIACRNLLIYLEPVLQQKLIPMLHYALRSPRSTVAGRVGDHRLVPSTSSSRWMRRTASTRAKVQPPAVVPALWTRLASRLPDAPSGHAHDARAASWSRGRKPTASCSRTMRHLQ